MPSNAKSILKGGMDTYLNSHASEWGGDAGPDQ